MIHATSAAFRPIRVRARALARRESLSRPLIPPYFIAYGRAATISPRYIEYRIGEWSGSACRSVTSRRLYAPKALLNRPAELHRVLPTSVRYGVDLVYFWPDYYFEYPEHRERPGDLRLGYWVPKLLRRRGGKKHFPKWRRILPLVRNYVKNNRDNNCFANNFIGRCYRLNNVRSFSLRSLCKCAS